MREAVRAGRHEGVGWRRRVWHPRGEKQIMWGPGHARGAHLEHLAHVRDAGRVEAELLVERRRALPSRKAGMCCGKAARGA